MSIPQPHYPSPAPIDAYGNGGFRFAGMSHRGHLLCLPTGIFGVEAAGADALAQAALAALAGAPAPHMVVLIGTGRRLVFLAPETRKLFAAVGIGVEVMDTGAACRTYNVLLAERRAVAAALTAVA